MCCWARPARQIHRLKAAMLSPDIKLGQMRRVDIGRASTKLQCRSAFSGESGAHKWDVSQRVNNLNVLYTELQRLQNRLAQKSMKIQITV